MIIPPRFGDAARSRGASVSEFVGEEGVSAVTELRLTLLQAALDPAPYRALGDAAERAFRDITHPLSIDHLNLGDFAARLKQSDRCARTLHQAADRLQRDADALAHTDLEPRPGGPHQARVCAALHTLQAAFTDAAQRLRRIAYVRERDEMRAIAHHFDPFLALCHRAIDDMRGELSPARAQVLAHLFGPEPARAYRKVLQRLSVGTLPVLDQMLDHLKRSPPLCAVLEACAARLQADHDILQAEIAGIDARLEQECARLAPGLASPQVLRHATRVLIDRASLNNLLINEAASDLAREPNPDHAGLDRVFKAIASSLDAESDTALSALCFQRRSLALLAARGEQLAQRFTGASTPLPSALMPVRAAMQGAVLSDLGENPAVRVAACQDHWSCVRIDHPAALLDLAGRHITLASQQGALLRARLVALETQPDPAAADPIRWTITTLYFWAHAALSALEQHTQSQQAQLRHYRGLGKRVELANVRLNMGEASPALSVVEGWLWHTQGALHQSGAQRARRIASLAEMVEQLERDID